MRQIARKLIDAEDGFLRDKRYLVMGRDGKGNTVPGPVVVIARLSSRVNSLSLKASDQAELYEPISVAARPATE